MNSVWKHGLRLAVAFLATSAAMGVETGLDRSGFDPLVRPQDDLFRAVNGAWLERTAIPADKADFGTFRQLRDRSDADVRAIVDDIVSRPSPDSAIEQKVADFYRAFVDLAAIDRAGIAPIKPLLAEIDAWKDKADLSAWLGRVNGLIETPIPLAVDADPKQPAVNRAETWQGGLGLPDRDYYLQDEARLVKARDAYRVYVETLARLAGFAEPAAVAQRQFDFELRLAKIQWDRVANRDVDKTYNPMTPEALQRLAPGLNWSALFSSASLAGIDRLTVSQPDYVVALARLVDELPLAEWQAYARIRVIDDLALVLPKAFREARFAFHGTALTGLAEDRPRWQRGIDAVNDALGEAIGQLYVERHFSIANKTRMERLVANLIRAYDQSIATATWMSPATKAKAHEKLAHYTVKIGYPQRWRDYGGLVVRSGDALGNQVRAARFEWQRIAARLGQPVDRSEWRMTPQTVNAYYDPNRNEIVFPAAILQPPFFDAAADDAVNYGAIGAVIGHEISHGFDDQGAKFDGDGALANWWTDADRQAFQALGERLVAQYSAYQPIAGKSLNGRLTLGENIADLSGLQIAAKAYRLSLDGKPAPIIAGLTGEQRFYFGWSQAWRTKVRDERALQLLTIDPHSPPAFRANGAAVNADGFHDAFGTQPGDAMYKPPAERIRIW